MKQITVKIKENIKEVLLQSKVENNQLFLPNIVLDRALYVDVNKILELLGGKWNRKLKCHVFEEISKGQLDAVLNGEEKIVDVKKTYQEFFTPEHLAQRVVELADINRFHIVLEPSCGAGSIARELVKKTQYVEVVEIQKENYEKTISSYNVVGFNGDGNKDFLTIEPPEIPYFDRICGNPPYSKNPWQKHTIHAYKFLKSGGRLVFILPANPNPKFYEWLSDKKYQVEDVEDKAFKDSGTLIKTVILVIDKE